MALADPTRRALFGVCAAARAQSVSSPGSQRSGSLASPNTFACCVERARARPQGRTRRYYKCSPEGLAELRRYIERMWDDVLGAYAAGDPDPPTKSTATSAKKRGAR